MADDHDAHHTSENPDRPLSVAQEKEDAETAATRKELKHTAISEQPIQGIAEADDSSSNSQDTPPPSKDTDDVLNDALREQVGSPKKKRAISEVETDKEELDTHLSLDATSPPPGSRTTRSEPEKKRARDEGSISEGSQNPKSTTDDSKQSSKPISTEPFVAPRSNTQVVSTSNAMTATANDAFKNSGFSALSSTQSPFATSGPVKSVFSGNTSTVSPFAPSTGGNSTFGGSSGTKTTSLSTAPVPLSLSNSSLASPFGISSNGLTTRTVFGSGFGGAFGSSTGRLSSFATPGQSSLASEGTKKAAKDFGAPESDGDEDEEESAGNDKNDGKDKAGSSGREKDKEGSHPPSEDKKKHRLQKVQVDDGEAGEATLLSVRTKMYALDKTTNSWKERGSGYLKINAPTASVELDDKGVPLPGSFDASSIEDSEQDDDKNAEDQEAKAGTPKGPRLLMRQDHTHRVILNTAIVPAIKFNQRDSLKAAHLIFQAFEESGIATLQLKMSTVNAKDFLKEIDSIQRELLS